MRTTLFCLILLLASCGPENRDPVALLEAKPPVGTVDTWFDLDASGSQDPDGLPHLLEYRWDILDDGKWETEFGNYRIRSHRFTQPGLYRVRVEVRDTYGGISSDLAEIRVDSAHFLTDPRDGQRYPVVRIGSNWWMARNLNIGITLAPEVRQTENGVIEKYVYPGDDPDGLFGGLYSWAEMMGASYTEGSAGICPPGWHIPSEADWKDLFSVYRREGVIYYPPYWIQGNGFVPEQWVKHENYQAAGAIWQLLRGTGSSGFDAVMVGYRDPSGAFSDRDYYFSGQTATFWTSTVSGEYAFRIRLYQADTHVGDAFRFADNKQFAFSVRCVKGI